MESSEDITRILDEFLSIREKVIGMQYEALVKYDAAIDSIDRIDSISSRVNRLDSITILRLPTDYRLPDSKV